jgi:hypothetical protein
MRGRTRPRDPGSRRGGNVLYAIIAFETYDVIAGPKRRFDAIAPIVHQLALTTLGLA